MSRRFITNSEEKEAYIANWNRMTNTALHKYYGVSDKTITKTNKWLGLVRPGQKATIQDMNKFLELFKTMSLTEVGKVFGVSQTAAHRVAVRLGILAQKEKRPYERIGILPSTAVIQDRDEYIPNWQKMTNRKLAEHYGVSSQTITATNQRFGLKKGEPCPITNDAEYLVLWPTMTNKELAEHYGVHLKIIIRMNIRLCLRRHPVVDKGAFTADWPLYSIRELVEKYAISRRTVYSVGESLGLKREKKMRKEKPVGRRKPEHGALRERKSGNGKPYMLIHVIEEGKCRWVPLHLYNWAKAGNVLAPKGRLLFIDGDTRNCDISNLQLAEKGKNRVLMQEQKLAERLLRKEQRAREAAEDKILNQRMRQQKAAKKEAKKAHQKRWSLRQPKKIAPVQPKVMKTKIVDLGGQKAIRIDSKTIIYLRPGQNEEEVLNRYRSKTA